MHREASTTLITYSSTVKVPWYNLRLKRILVDSVVEPPSTTYRTPDFNLPVTTNIELVPVGSDVVFTVHGWSNTQQQRTITAKYVFPHMYLITRFRATEYSEDRSSQEVIVDG